MPPGHAGRPEAASSVAPVAHSLRALPASLPRTTHRAQSAGHHRVRNSYGLVPEPVERRDRPGPGLGARLRADAAPRHHRGGGGHRAALDRPLGLLARPGRRPRLPCGDVGRARRHRRRAPLPRDHELEHGRRRVVGAVRRLGGRPRRLGRHRPGRARRRLGREALGRERLRVHGRGSARAPARAGDRAVGELLQPGAVREADRPALVRGDLARQPSGRLLALRDLPPDLPLRVALVPARGRRPAPGRPAVQPEAAGPLRPLRHVVLRRPLRHGAPAHRRGARVPRTCA